jgi:hypothetical protein
VRAIAEHRLRRIDPDETPLRVQFRKGPQFDTTASPDHKHLALLRCPLGHQQCRHLLQVGPARYQAAGLVGVGGNRTGIVEVAGGIGM